LCPKCGICDARAWFNALEKASAGTGALARVPRRSHSRDEFELALGKAVTACRSTTAILLRRMRLLRGTRARSEATLWPCVGAPAIGAREAYGAKRYNEARKAA
jgi:hypothetical protein